MAVPKKIVLSQPFSGSLYAFFDRHLGGSMTRDGKRPPLAYYRALFGSNYRKFTELSLTLLVLFPEVILAPADNHMPDIQGCETDGNYQNPRLGLSTSWRDFLEIQRELNEHVSKDLEDPRIKKVLFPLSSDAKRQVLFDTRYDIYLAMVNDCPIVSAGGRRRLIDLLTASDYSARKLATSVSQSHLALATSYLDMVGIVFDPVSVNGLYTLKNDKTLRPYADGFTRVMLSASDPAGAQWEMAALTRDAMDTDGLLKFATGGLKGTAEVLSFHPGLKAQASSLALKAGAKFVGDFEKRQRWYQLGPQIKRILSLQNLREATNRILAHPPPPSVNHEIFD
jgi:hypothetical protein